MIKLNMNLLYNIEYVKLWNFRSLAFYSDLAFSHSQAIIKREKLRRLASLACPDVYDTMQATGVIWVSFSWQNSSGSNFHLRKVSYTISDAELPVDSKNAIKNTPLAS